jgi:hypothetical protein
MKVHVDAVNRCHAPALYRYQLQAAQIRCNINRTTELVLHIAEDGNVIEQQVIVPNRDLPTLARNEWKPQ